MICFNYFNVCSQSRFFIKKKEAHKSIAFLKLYVRLHFGRFIQGQRSAGTDEQNILEPNWWYRHFGEEKNNKERSTWKESVVTSFETNKSRNSSGLRKPTKTSITTVRL